jgi:transcriptional/translational regulatory protein YebC/TACO1
LNIDDGVKVMKVIELIEEDDDVQNVFHNMEVTDEIIDAMDN